MTLLAIETATEAVGCALWEAGRPVASFTLARGRRHAEVLMPAVQHLCEQAGLRPHDLAAVAVDVGPGLFTGLRVGLATARALALALGAPAVGVSSLEALAYPHRARAGLVAAVVDAKRSEVFWSLYRPDQAGGLALVRPPAVAGPSQVAAELAGQDEPVLVVGDGAWRYRELFAGPRLTWAGPAHMWPSPLVVAELGEQRLASLGGAAAALPEPMYLRQADVKIGWEQMSGTVAGRLAQ